MRLMCLLHDPVNPRIPSCLRGPWSGDWGRISASKRWLLQPAGRARGRGRGRLLLCVWEPSLSFILPLSPAFFPRLSIFSALFSTASFQDLLRRLTHSEPQQGEEGAKGAQGRRQGPAWTTGRVKP